MNTYNGATPRRIAEFAISFPILHDLLHLPEGAVIQYGKAEMGDMERQQIRLIITHPDLPLMQEGDVIPHMCIVITKTEDGYETKFE